MKFYSCSNRTYDNAKMKWSKHIYIPYFSQCVGGTAGYPKRSIFYRYYGYRNQNNEIDHRLKVFSHHPYLFQDKDILDIGCNIGHVTLSVARDFGAKTVIGIDIDDKLISIARKNIKHYVKSVNSPRADELLAQEEQKCSSEFYPISMPILYGPIDVPGFEDYSKNRGFPKNVTFKRVSWVY